MNGVELIKQERLEQIQKHGFDHQHDLKYKRSELVKAAIFLLTKDTFSFPETWDKKYKEKFTQKHGIEALKVAGALIAAEIDRLQISENI